MKHNEGARQNAVSHTKDARVTDKKHRYSGLTIYWRTGAQRKKENNDNAVSKSRLQ